MNPHSELLRFTSEEQLKLNTEFFCATRLPTASCRPRFALVHGLPLLIGDRTQLFHRDGTQIIVDSTPAYDAGSSSALVAVCCSVCACLVARCKSHLCPCFRALNHGGLREMRKLISRATYKAPPRQRVRAIKLCHGSGRRSTSPASARHTHALRVTALSGGWRNLAEHLRHVKLQGRGGGGGGSCCCVCFCRTAKRRR